MAGHASKRGETQQYLVTTVLQARTIVSTWLAESNFRLSVSLGLPEIDDRHHVWRIPLCHSVTNVRVGEAVVGAYTGAIIETKTSRFEMIQSRLVSNNTDSKGRCASGKKRIYSVSNLQNTIGLGDCIDLMGDLPSTCVDLVFTSPPYFNARPEYSDYDQYDQYLIKMRETIRSCHRVLNEGRFFVLNISPVLIRRTRRSEASKRIAVPFDLHRIFIEEGFDFIDDIIWVKPEGAGWATGRGRRFAADRNPLQYKAVPVTEYILVYRKQTDLLIDWHIRNHPDRELVAASKIGDDYERTNIWRIQPKTHSRHPAAFPLELAQKVIKYYSFKNDVVLDPFAGSGTVGAAAISLHRRFVLFEANSNYIDIVKSEFKHWSDKKTEVSWLNTLSPEES